MEENIYDFSTKKELINKLIAYSESPDDDNIRYKNKIKEILLNTPELLYALHDEELESELFNEDGTLNTEGEWDRYFGETSLIRPFYSFHKHLRIRKTTYVIKQCSMNLCVEIMSKNIWTLHLQYLLIQETL